MEWRQEGAQCARAAKHLAQACCAEDPSPSSSASHSSQVDQKRQRPGFSSLDRMSTDSTISTSQPSASSTAGGICPSSGCSDGAMCAPASFDSSISVCGSQTHNPAQPVDITHWRSREAEYTPKGIFEHQIGITPAMREMLVEWMCEVVMQFRMHQETFLLAVNYLDRYMSRKAVPRSTFQLLGLTCLWAAAKYEEVHPLSARQLLESADHAFTRAQMIAQETDIMQVLAWNLAPVTSLKLLHLYLVNCNATTYMVQAVGECMLQLGSLDYSLCAEQPAAHVAAAAACVALTTCQLTHLVPQVVVASGWSDAHALAQMSHDMYARFQQLSAPGMPFHPVIAQYAQRQVAFVRQAQLEQALAEMVATKDRATSVHSQPAAPTVFSAPKQVPAAASLHTSMTAKLAMPLANKSNAMDCMPRQDQTHKIYNLLALKRHQQHLAALAAQRQDTTSGTSAISSVTGGAAMPGSSVAMPQHPCLWRA